MSQLRTNSIVPVGGLPAGASGGGIIQVVSATASTGVTVTTATYTDTGLTASITPSSASSKILVLVNQVFSSSKSTNYTYGGIRLLRNSTTILNPSSDGTGPYELGTAVTGGSAVAVYGRYTAHILDSPGTTSSVTYKTQCRPWDTGSNSAFVVQGAGSPSHITLLEVSA
jgi:hypothetical protein